MKMLLAADGSEFTKKALAFLVANEKFVGADDELVVLNVQPPMPPRVRSLVGAATVNDYQREEAEKVLKPIEKFMARQACRTKFLWKVGQSAEEILKVAKAEKVQMIVMGTHGHGLLGRAVMGSVAQRVVAHCDIPVLLVK